MCRSWSCVPGAAWETKRWGSELRATQRCADPSFPGENPAHLGTGEESLIQRVVRATAYTPAIAPATTLLQLAALIARSRAFVGGDTDHCILRPQWGHRRLPSSAHQAHSVMGHMGWGMWSCIENFLVAIATSGLVIIGSASQASRLIWSSTLWLDLEKDGSDGLGRNGRTSLPPPEIP